VWRILPSHGWDPHHYTPVIPKRETELDLLSLVEKSDAEFTIAIRPNLRPQALTRSSSS